MPPARYRKDGSSVLQIKVPLASDKDIVITKGIVGQRSSSSFKLSLEFEISALNLILEC